MPNTLYIQFDTNDATFVSEINKAILKKWTKALRIASKIIKEQLKYQLVFGGRRINGFIHTAAYQWITSPTGIGQLGLSARSMIDDLLVAISDSIRVIVTDKGELFVTAMNLSVLAASTPHPKTNSWFVDWIYKQKSVKDARFVEFSTVSNIRGGTGNRSYLPRSFPVVGLKSGWMFKPGSWSAPAFLKQSIDSWISRNAQGISNLIIEIIQNALRGTI